MNTYKNIPIVYNQEILSRIREIIEEEFEKLKAFVKKVSYSTKTPNFEFYNELDEKFDEITFKLKELKLCNEFNYFISISDYILYIVHQNSIDSTFGHCNFAIELLEFFMKIFQTNTNYYNSSLNADSEEFKIMQNSFKDKYHQYRREFYWNIYEQSDDFDEKEMYEFAKTLRE